MDNDGDGAVDPGDTLRYVVGVANVGGFDAEGVTFTDIVDFNSELVAGSGSVTPIARSVGYAAEENVTLTVPVGDGVLVNDNDVDGGTVTVYSVEDDASNVGASTATSSGGTVTVLSDGTFAYTPPTDFEGPDSFVYEVIDDEGHLDSATVYLIVQSGHTTTGLANAPGTPSGSESVSISGGQLTAELGLLNAGQVVHIHFDVIMDTTIEFDATFICNQGLFGGSNFADVLTDAPSTSVSAHPTCTALDLDPENPVWSMPTDFTVPTDPGANTATVNYSATVSDNVGVVSSSCTPSSGGHVRSRNDKRDVYRR